MRRSLLRLLVLLAGILLSLDFSAAADKDQPPEEPPNVEPEDPGDGRPVQLALDAGGHTAVKQVLFTADSKEVITVSLDKTVRIWDLATGQTTRVLRPPSSTGGQGKINDAALSPDGKTLAVSALAYRDKKWIGLVYLIRLGDGHIERSLERHREPHLAALAFSPDGKRLATLPPGDPAIRIWSTATGKVEQEFKIDRVPSTLAFSPDGQLLAGGFGRKGIGARVWSLTSGKLLHEVPSEHPFAAGVAWGLREKRQLLGVYTRDGLAVLERDGDTFQELWYEKQPGWDFGITRCLAFTADGRWLMHIGDVKSSVFLRDAETGKEVRRFSPASGRLDIGAVSPDGRWLVVADAGDGYPSNVFVFKTADEKNLVHRLAGRGQPIAQAVWTADGQGVAWTNKLPGKGAEPVFPRSFDLVTLEFGPEVREKFHGAQLTRDSLSLQKKGGDLEILKDEKLIRTITGNPPHFTLLANDYLALSEYKGEIVLHSTGTGKRLRPLQGHTAIVTSLATSPSGRYLLSSGADQVLHLWNPEQEKTAPKDQPLHPLLSLFVAGNDWVAWTQEGYYAASPGGEKLVGWTTSNGPDRLMSFYPVERFRKKLYRPDVIRLVLDKGSVALALKEANAKANIKDDKPVDLEQLLPPKVKLKEIKENKRGKKTRLHITASAEPGSRSQPVEELRLLLDGRVHPDAEPKKFKAGQRPEAEWEIDEVPGRHELKVLARCPDVAGVSEAYLLHTEPPDADKPVLFRVCVGINDYDQPGLRLRAAKEDAEAVFAALPVNCTGKGNLFREARGKLLVDKEATRDAVLEALRKVRQKDGDKEGAKPGDLVVLFFAGHGVVKDGEFYLLTREADTDKPLKDKALSGADLRQALGEKEMPCSVLLLLDACHSAAGVKALKPATDDLTRSLTDDQVAVTVLSAAMGYESAREEKEHGLFTRAVLKGLQADRGVPADPYDRQLYVHDLYGLVFREVRRASNGAQNPFLNMPWTVPPLALRLLRDKPSEK